MRFIDTEQFAVGMIAGAVLLLLVLFALGALK